MYFGGWVPIWGAARHMNSQVLLDTWHQFLPATGNGIQFCLSCCKLLLKGVINILFVGFFVDFLLTENTFVSRWVSIGSQYVRVHSYVLSGMQLSYQQVAWGCGKERCPRGTKDVPPPVRCHHQSACWRWGWHYCWRLSRTLFPKNDQSATQTLGKLRKEKLVIIICGGF